MSGPRPAGGPPTRRPLLRRAVLDVSPLRSSVDYRWLYSGQLVAFLARELTVVAVPLQIFGLTRSSLAVGLIGLVQVGPLIVGSMLGGSLADAIDRRRLLLATQVLTAVTSLGLAVNATLPRPAVWPLFVLIGLGAGLSGVDSPARNAAIPALVPRGQLPAAFALNQTMSQTSHVVGPALAGVLIAEVNLASAYWLSVAAYAVAALALLRIRPLTPEGGGRAAGMASIMEGLRFLRGRRILQGTFAIDLNAMIFGMPRALFPELGTTVFGGGPSTVGLLYAAPGAGALVGALTSGWVGSIRRRGWAVLVAVGVWGAAVTGFGLSRWLPVALLLLALAGAADVVSAVFRNTILQLSVPDALRGRLSAIHVAVVAAGPRLGDAEAGAVAAVTSAQFSAVSGGLACLLGVGVVARIFPQFAAYRDDGGDGAPQVAKP